MPHSVHHSLLLLLSDFTGLLGRGDIKSMGLTLFLRICCTRSRSFLNLAKFRFGSVDMFVKRAVCIILVLHKRLFMWVRFDTLACSWNIGVQDGSFTWTGDATTLGDELVVGSALIDITQFLLWRRNKLCCLDGTLGEQIAADEREVIEKFTNLGVRENESKQGAEVLDSCFKKGDLIHEQWNKECYPPSSPSDFAF